MIQGNSCLVLELFVGTCEVMARMLASSHQVIWMKDFPSGIGWHIQPCLAEDQHSLLTYICIPCVGVSGRLLVEHQA